MKRFIALLALGLIAAAGLAVTACGDSSDADPAANDAWSRTTAPGQATGVIYLTIEGGSEADTLVAVAVPSDVAEAAEIHETVPLTDDEAAGHGDDHGDHEDHAGHDEHAEHDGHEGHDSHDGHEGHDEHADHDSAAMTMRQLHEVEIPAGGTVALEPGGIHIMLLELAGSLVAGQEIPVTLTFTQAGDLEVMATVRDG